jgi:uncharacterized heparinase superfamily protein
MPGPVDGTWQAGPALEAWIEAEGRSAQVAETSAVYRMRLSGHPPAGLRALPKDLRPASPERGRAILEGRWRFGSASVTAPEDSAPWGPPFPSPHFADRLHRMNWLRDLGAHGPAGQARARALTASWNETFGKWDGFAWRLSPTADRVINLLSAGPWLIGELPPGWRADLLDSLARQVRHLAASAIEEADPAARLRIATALCLAGAALDDGQRFLDEGLILLEKETQAQILADGGHASRSPEALAYALLDVHAVEELLLRLGRAGPAFLSKLQARMSPLLSFFTLPGGDLLPANGGGDGGGLLAGVALAQTGGREAKFSFARLSGYQRVQADELTLYMDAEAGPARLYGGRAHAGALAITIYDGPEALITSCAANPDLDPSQRLAARRTPAHSVLSVRGEDSAVFQLEPATGMRAPVGPAAAAVRRLEENDQFLLEGQHAGWRMRHGLIYRRRLYIARNGGRITGEDSLFRPVSENVPPASGPEPFEIRFHLHPDAQAAPGPDDRTLFIGLPKRQRVWRFRCEAVLSVEESRYWGSEVARRTNQIVIRGEAMPDGDGSRPPNRVRWALSRIEPAV